MDTNGQNEPGRGLSQCHLGKVYIVFGGSGGIGSEVAKELTQAGAKVVVTGRDEARLSSISKELNCESKRLCLSEQNAVDEVVSQTIEKYESLDGVVNCIGSIYLKPAHLTGDSDWDSVIETNLTSSFKILRASASAMMRTGGSIVLFSSAAARVGIASHEAIAAAKAGVIGLCLSASATYARRGIRVNCIAPGMVCTQMTRQICSNETSRHASESMHALGRIGEPSDIAGAVSWLLSSQSSWVTGQTIGVDGGLSKVRSKV